jgi:hypothetical protein
VLKILDETTSWFHLNFTLGAKTPHKEPMKPSHRTISLVLVVFLLSSGLPLFSPQDANRDTIIGLDDAISRIKDFARTADNSASFTTSVEKLLSTLHVIAGLKTVIKPAHDPKSTSPAFSLDSPYLISAYDGATFTDNRLFVYEEASFYHSIVFTPSPPPPNVV